MDERAIDVQVAEKVMGWKWMHILAKHNGRNEDYSRLVPGHTYEAFIEEPNAVWQPGILGVRDNFSVPHYSSDIAAAWAVVEHMQALGFGWLLEPHAHLYYCEFHREFYVKCWDSEQATIPMAICRAALLALEVGE